MTNNETATTTRKPSKKALRLAAEIEAVRLMGGFKAETPILDEDVNDEPDIGDADAELEAHEQNEALEAELADEGDEAKPRSVVRGTYKAKYAERGETARKAKGFSKKAAKRSCSDWLAQTLGVRTLDAKAVLNVPAFEAILTANGVKHDHWNRTTKGWQGRLRMTGRLALQRVVAENGELAIPGEDPVKAPRTWVDAHQR